MARPSRQSQNGYESECVEVIFVACHGGRICIKAHEDAPLVKLPMSKACIIGYDRPIDVPHGKIVKLVAPYEMLFDNGLI